MLFRCNAPQPLAVGRSFRQRVHCIVPCLHRRNIHKQGRSDAMAASNDAILHSIQQMFHDRAAGYDQDNAHHTALAQVILALIRCSQKFVLFTVQVRLVRLAVHACQWHCCCCQGPHMELLTTATYRRTANTFAYTAFHAQASLLQSASVTLLNIVFWCRDFEAFSEFMNSLLINRVCQHSVPGADLAAHISTTCRAMVAVNPTFDL